VQRKKQAKMRLLEKKEAAETKKETNVEEMRQRERLNWPRAIRNWLKQDSGSNCRAT